MRVAICIEFDQTMAETLLPQTLEKIGEFVFIRKVEYERYEYVNFLEVIGNTQESCTFLIEKLFDDVYHTSIKVDEV